MVIKIVLDALTPSVSVTVIITAVWTNGSVGVPTRYTELPEVELNTSPYDSGKDKVHVRGVLFADEVAEKRIEVMGLETM